MTALLADLAGTLALLVAALAGALAMLLMMIGFAAFGWWAVGQAPPDLGDVD